MTTYAQTVRLRQAFLPSSKFQNQFVPPELTRSLIDEINPSLRQALPEPRTIEAAGIPHVFLNGLALKTLYFGGPQKGWQIAQSMRLNFSGVVEPVLQTLRNHQLIQVTGGNNSNRATFNVGRPMRACHPRDLLGQLIDHANYLSEPAEMTVELIDRAARSYFDELF